MSSDFGVDTDDVHMATSNSDSPREEPISFTNSDTRMIDTENTMETTTTKTDGKTDAAIDVKTTNVSNRQKRPRNASSSTKSKKRPKPSNDATTTLTTSTTPAMVAPSVPTSGFMVYDNHNNPVYRVVPMIFSGPSTMVPFPTAPGVESMVASASSSGSGSAPMETDDTEMEDNKPKKKKGEKKPRKHGPFDAAKYMARIRTLMTPEERTARRGSIITEKNIKKRFTTLTDDEMKFVQKESMSAAELERLLKIAERTQYHGFFLKYVFGKEGVPLGRFVNETSVPSETDEKVRVYVDNTPDDMKKRAQKTGRIVQRTTKNAETKQEIVTEYPEFKVIYIGEVCGPGMHKPLMTDYRVMNSDYAKLDDVKETATANDAKETEPTPPATPPPPKPKEKEKAKLVSPKRSPGRPPKNASSTVTVTASVPPPQTITKAPQAPQVNQRTVSMSLKKQVADQVLKHPAVPPVAMNGFHGAGDE